MSSDQAPGRRSQNECESVDELGPHDTGVWLVTTRHTTHTLDLDRHTYRRNPGPGGTPMEFDGQTVVFTRLLYPRVGYAQLVFFDDPATPALLEHWRQSSTITAIQRLPHDPNLDGAG